MMIYLLADLSEMKVQIETRSLSLLSETYCFHFVIYLGGVQYVDSRNVEKNADKMEMPNTKCRLAKR